MEKDASSSSSSSSRSAGGEASLLPHNNAIPNPNSSVMSIQLNHLSAASSFLQDNELFVTHFFSAPPPQPPPQHHHHLISSMAPLNTEEAAHHHQHLITSPLVQKKNMNKVTRRKAAAGHGDGCVAPRKARGPGKKDRHSKICTAKGPRDRRMRLSLQIARRFFDLQDMLGFDKASKTIDWLFSKSKSAIKDLIITTTTTTTKPPHHQEEEEEEVEEGKASIEADDDPSAVYPNPSKIVQEGKESKGKKSTKTSAAAACLAGPDLARESRERARARARARARERTKEKMMLRRSLDDKKFRNPNDTGCQISGSGMSSFTSQESSSSNNKTEEEAGLLPREPEATAAATACIIAETAINKNASSSQGFMPETAINPAMPSFSAGTPPHTISINSSGDHLIMDADVLSNFCFLSQLLENHHHL